MNAAGSFAAWLHAGLLGVGRSPLPRRAGRACVVLMAAWCAWALDAGIYIADKRAGGLALGGGIPGSDLALIFLFHVCAPCLWLFLNRQCWREYRRAHPEASRALFTWPALPHLTRLNLVLSVFSFASAAGFWGRCAVIALLGPGG